MAYRSIVLACCALATAAMAKMPATDPSGMDVAGVRLRMTPAETRAALTAAGYRVEAPRTSDSFLQGARKEADRRLGRPVTSVREAGVSSITAYGPRLERAEIIFAQTPAGSVVAEVSFSIPETSITSADFIAQARAKYGRPGSVRFDGSEMTWCVAEVGANCGLPSVATGPRPSDFPELRTTSYGGGGRIRLTSGERWADGVNREWEAAVEALAPKSRKAAF